MRGPRVKRGLLWAALAVTLGSAILAPSKELKQPEAGATRPAAPQSVPRRDEAKVEVTHLEPLERQIDRGPIVDLFDSRQPPAVPPPKPSAPPLPFAYMGSLGEGRNLKIYLVQGETMFEAAVGATFAPNYRLDAVAAEGLTITYLPLDIQQQLSTGGAR